VRQKRYFNINSQMVPAKAVSTVDGRDFDSYEINANYITNLDGVVIGDNIIELIKRIVNMQDPNGAVIVIHVEPRDSSDG
jgi:hypothetical protein